MHPIKFLSDIMIQILNFFYAISGNYGLAIILLTVAVKLALYPLTVQSTQQMKAMQKIQPKLQEIQKKFKDKPDQLQKEMMGLYKSHGVNPLGGCLPMLLQVPFFIALFVAFTSPEFGRLVSQPGVRASFLWITDLTKADPYFVMVGLMGLSTYWTQKMMSPGTSQGQAMTMFMPIFIAFISARFPAGVQLYWVMSNLLTMAQQWYILREK